MEEALQLGREGISLPILILGFTPAECARLLAEQNLSQCVYSYEYGQSLSAYAEEAGVRVKIHVKLDTGMGRIGFRCIPPYEEELEAAARVSTMKGLIPEGIFTHFAVADGGESGEAYTKEQGKRFAKGVAALEERGIHFALRHCANSAAIFDYPELHFDMVRAGIVLYGFAPSEKVRNLPTLTPVMTLRTVLSHLKKMEAGESVSYGRTFEASEPMRVATVPIGYADGVSRRLGNERYSLRIGEAYAPILGRICMDQLMLDVTQVSCSVGDQVTVFGQDPTCSAERMAGINETISYEVTCDVAKRVPRVYCREGKPLFWRDFLIPDDGQEKEEGQRV
jgi:alanine racemase